MKINKKYQIEKAASTDETRHPLMNVHIAEDGKHLVATTGRMLAIVPVEMEPNDERGNGAIMPTALIAARKTTKKNDSACRLALNGSFQLSDGVTLPRPENPGVFPQYAQVIPKDPVIKHTVTLNPELLLSLAKALGDSRSITLEFQEDELSAIIARNGEAYGLLMPMKTIEGK